MTLPFRGHWPKARWANAEPAFQSSVVATPGVRERMDREQKRRDQDRAARDGRLRVGLWSREEITSVGRLYVQLNGERLHELCPEIVALAGKLGRKVRGVENQLLMFRNLDRGGDYAYGNMSRLCREAWDSFVRDELASIRRGTCVGHGVPVAIATEDSGMRERPVGETGVGHGVPVAPPDDPARRAIPMRSPLVPEAAPPVHMNDVVSLLLARGHGGGQSANVPTGELPAAYGDAPAPAGVRDAFERLAVAFLDPQGATQWVFLVGGPGNGKSHQLQKLYERLGLEPPVNDTGDIARRKYEPHQSLRLINDATIRTGAPGELSRDLRSAAGEAVDRALHLVVNVNRGILLEEAAALAHGDDWHPAASLISWLAGPAREYPDLHEVPVGGDYYRRALLDVGEGRSVAVHAVFMDVLSLLEPLPAPEGACITEQDDGHFKVKRYRVHPLTHQARLESPAGLLLEKLLDEAHHDGGACGNCGARSLCPIRANVQSLRDANVRLGVLSVLRAAEIASGRLMTYRDLWTTFMLGIVGRRRAAFDELHPCEWVERLVPEIDTEDSDSLRHLSEQRFYGAIFADHDPELGSVQAVPFDAAMGLVDPAADATPGRLVVAGRALQSASYGGSPIEILATDDQALASVVCALDVKFEEGVVFAGANEHRAVFGMAAYGRRLSRLVGLVHGLPAHAEAITEWLALRLQLSPRPVTVPSGSRLRVGLDRLVFPVSQVRGSGLACLLPVFESRTNPIEVGGEQTVWCYPLPLSGTNSVEWLVRTLGDGIVVELKRADKVMAEFPLDFAMCREALAGVAIGLDEPHYGFTDSSASILPRLERTRAALLGQAAQANFRLVAVNSSVHPLILNAPAGTDYDE